MLTHQENAYQLSDRCGVPQPTIQRILTGKHAEPRSSTLRKIALAYGVSESYLRGTLENFDLDPIQSIRLLKSDPSVYDDSVRIEPLFFPNLVGQGVVSLHVKRAWLDQGGFLTHDCLRVLNQIGDSMEPSFYNGDLLLVDVSQTLVKNEGVYVLSAQAKLLVRRVRQRMNGDYEVSSDNPGIKTVDLLPAAKDSTVLGKVVAAWHSKKL